MGREIFTNPDNIVCRRCGSNSLRKEGFSREKQKYLCKNCNYRLVENPYPKGSSKLPSKAFCFDDDVWFLDSLGISLDEADHYRRLNFSEIEQTWLKLLIKKYIKLVASQGAAPKTLCVDLKILKKFSVYIKDFTTLRSMEDLNRNILLNFFSLLPITYHPRTIASHLTALKKFIDNGNLNGWFNLPSYLIRSEDYPKPKKGTPNAIPK